MSLGRAFATYLIFWTITLFFILPLRVRTAHEEGRVPIPGQADGAPTDPRLLWKAKWTTIAATALFAIYYLSYTHGWVTLANLPWIKRPRDFGIPG